MFRKKKGMKAAKNTKRSFQGPELPCISCNFTRVKTSYKNITTSFQTQSLSIIKR